MKAHKPTPIQKKILRFMLGHDYVEFHWGYKITQCGTNENGKPAVGCQSFVPYFLKHHGYIESESPNSFRYRLTDKGREAARHLRGTARTL